MGLYDDEDDDEKKVIEPNETIEIKAGISSSENGLFDEEPTKKKSRNSLKDDEDDVILSTKSAQSKPSTSTSTSSTDDQSKFALSSISICEKGKVDHRFPALLWTMRAKKGERDEMQDGHLVEERLMEERADIFRCALYGIFDGHGGARAAHFCEKSMAALLEQKMQAAGDLAQIEKSLKKIFTETYKQVDELFLAEARKNKPVWKDGTTATTILFLNAAIYAANIGDSRAIVAREQEDSKEMLPIRMTIDHHPLQHDERMRIQKTGGNVKDGRVNGLLEVSRSIGDGQFKAYGVIATPDLKKLTITERDRFLLIACDGLWKSFTDEEAIGFVKTELEKAKKLEWILLSKRPEQAAWDHVAELLCAEAIRRKCGDNVSVLLVKFELSPKKNE